MYLELIITVHLSVPDVARLTYLEVITLPLSVPDVPMSGHSKTIIT